MFNLKNERSAGLRPPRRLPSLKSKRRLVREISPRRLTSRFGRIENVKNFDVEKWYNFKVEFYRKLKVSMRN
jgi:hypothetical protein